MMLKVFLLYMGIGALYGYAVPMKRATTCTPPPHASGRCSCIDDIASCTDLHGLTSFSGTPVYKRLEITQSPNIGTFQNNSFAHLQVEELTLLADNIRDQNITRWSFFPLRDELKSLSLAENRLSILPEALLELNNLEKLDVVGNPIDENGFTETIMRKIGKTLLEFHLGSKQDLAAWPKTMKHLQMLRVLEIDGADFNIIPQRAFYGFEGTLRKLTIQNTNLLSVPLAIVRNIYLDTLHFDHNERVGDAGMNVPVIEGYLPYLQNTSLKDDGIKTFPIILGKFKQLTNLNMDDNELNFVSDISAKTISKITSLSLRHSGINRIPGALQFMTSLQRLDMSNNTIHGVEQNDLAHLVNLKMLNLSYNPILYISPYAFKGLNSSFHTIDLRNTKLLKVPIAIKELSANNIKLDLTGDQIECTCELEWLLKWKKNQHKTIDVQGECETVESSINNYIRTLLPLCE